MASTDHKEKDKDKERQQWTIPPVVAIDVLAYYDLDDTVQMCEQFLTQRIFNRIPVILSDPSLERSVAGSGSRDTLTSWYVEWNFGGLVTYPSLFNTDEFLNALSVFLRRARVHVRVLGYVAFWYRKDMASWVRDCVRTASAGVGRAGLPFGVLEPHEYELQFKRKAFANDTAAPSIRVLNEGGAGPGIACDIYVHDMQLIPVPMTLLEGAEQRTAEQFADSPLVQHACSSIRGAGSGARNLVVPRSVYYGLHEEKLLITEARVNLWDADWAATHPRVLLNSQPPPTLNMSVNNLSDHDRYTTDTVMEAAQAQSMRMQTFTYSEVINSLANTLRHNGLLPAEGGEAGRTTPREARRRYYHRPDAVQDAYVFPEIARVAAAPTAQVINDAPYLMRLYTENVRTHMGLPSTTTLPRSVSYNQRRSRKALGGVTDVANMVGREDDEYMDDLVSHERDVMASVFDAVWMAAFNAYDMQSVSNTIHVLIDRLEKEEEKEEKEEEVKEGEEKGDDKGMDPAAAADYLIQDAKNKNKNKNKKKRGENNRKRLQVTVQSLRELMNKAERHPRATASLVFESNHERKNRDRLNVMMALYPEGLVDPKELERALRAVYGQHVVLREPPVPPSNGDALEPSLPEKTKTKRKREPEPSSSESDSSEAASESEEEKKPKKMNAKRAKKE